MRLKRLEVQHWRGLAGPLAIDFHSRLTVVAGPNESGKSTLRDALRMALLEKYSSASKAIKATRPWDTPHHPRVELSFELDGRLYRVSKSFMKKKDGAALYEGTKLVAEDEAVQPRLDALLGARSQWIETLWGVQGTVSLATGVPDTLKGRLASASQETVSPGLVWLEQHIEQAYGQYWTEKTGRPKAGLSDGEDRVIETESNRRDAQQALEAANQREADLAARMARLDVARQQLLDRTDALQEARERLQAWEAWRRATEDMRRFEEQSAGVRRWLEAWNTAVDRVVALSHDNETYSSRLQAAAPGPAPDRGHVEELRTLETYLKLSMQLDLAQSIERLLVPDKKDIARLQELDRQLKAIEASLSMGLMTVAFDAETRTDLEVTADGESQATVVEAGATEEWQVAASIGLRLPGVGTVRVASGNSQAQAQVARRLEYQKELSTLLKRAKAKSTEEVLERQRQKAMLEGQLGGARPDREAWEAMRAAIADVADLDPVDKAARLAALPPQIAAAETAWKQASDRYGAAQTGYQALLQANPQDSLSAAWETLQTLLVTAAAIEPRPALPELGTADWQKSAREVATPWEQLARTLESEVSERANTVIRPEGTEISEAVLKGLREAVERTSAEVDTIDRECQQSIGALSAQGPLYTALVRAQEAEARAVRDQQAARLEADAVKLLRQTFSAAQAGLRQNVMEPLQKRVAARLAGFTQERYSGVHFDTEWRLDTVVPSRKSPAAVTDLSFGTQEQLMVLTRVCLAEMLAENDVPQVVMLDDNLVHTDSERMIQACAMLAQVSDRVQVVIFTCHPERYQFQTQDLHTHSLA